MSKKPQYDPEEIRFPDQKIETSYLVHEMEQSYIEYAMSVIVGRALPDVRDGLKPSSAGRAPPGGRAESRSTGASSTPCMRTT